MHGTDEEHNPEWKTPFERARRIIFKWNFKD
jgi:hypothetical protein